MRLKSFTIRCDFRMWNSWKFRTEIRKNESEEVSEQLTNSFFIDFDVFLFVASVKLERFDEMIVLKNVSDSNIWFRDVAKRIDEANCEVSEQMIVDFFAILYADSNVETRKSEFLTDFRAWCWRICSWSLLLKLKFCLHRLQIARAQTIREFDVIFVSFDVILDVAIERLEHFDETNCKDILVSITRLLDVAERIDDFCEEDEHVIADFFSASHIELSAWDRKDELIINFFACCLRLCLRSNSLNLNVCLQCRHVVDFFAISHVNLIVSIKKNELTIEESWTSNF